MSAMNAASFEALYSAFDGIMNAPVRLNDVVLAEMLWAAFKSLFTSVVILSVVREISSWLPLTAAVELIRPLFLGQWPTQALQHLAVLVAYGVGAFWVALALTRRRFRG